MFFDPQMLSGLGASQVNNPQENKLAHDTEQLPEGELFSALLAQNLAENNEELLSAKLSATSALGGTVNLENPAVEGKNTAAVSQFAGELTNAAHNLIETQDISSKAVVNSGESKSARTELTITPMQAETNGGSDKTIENPAEAAVKTNTLARTSQNSPGHVSGINPDLITSQNTALQNTTLQASSSDWVNNIQATGKINLSQKESIPTAFIKSSAEIGKIQQSAPANLLGNLKASLDQGLQTSNTTISDVSSLEADQKIVASIKKVPTNFTKSYPTYAEPRINPDIVASSVVKNNELRGRPATNQPVAQNNLAAATLSDQKAPLQFSSTVQNTQLGQTAQTQAASVYANAQTTIVNANIQASQSNNLQASQGQIDFQQTNNAQVGENQVVNNLISNNQVNSTVSRNVVNDQNIKLDLSAFTATPAEGKQIPNNQVSATISQNIQSDLSVKADYADDVSLPAEETVKNTDAKVEKNVPNNGKAKFDLTILKNSENGGRPVFNQQNTIQSQPTSTDIQVTTETKTSNSKQQQAVVTQLGQEAPLPVSFTVRKPVQGQHAGAARIKKGSLAKLEALRSGETKQNPILNKADQVVPPAGANEFQFSNTNDQANKPSEFDLMQVPPAVESPEASLPEAEIRASVHHTATEKMAPTQIGQTTASGRASFSSTWIEMMQRRSPGQPISKDGWQSLKIQLPESEGEMMIKTRRENEKVAVTVGFSDPNVQNTAQENLHRIEMALQEQYQAEVDLTFMDQNMNSNEQSLSDFERSGNTRQNQHSLESDLHNQSLTDADQKERKYAGQYVWVG